MYVVQESDDRQTWVLKAPGEQVMADFPHTAEGHTDAVRVCNLLNGAQQPVAVQLGDIDFKIIPKTGSLEISFDSGLDQVSRILCPYEIELLILWLGKYGLTS